MRMKNLVRVAAHHICNDGRQNLVGSRLSRLGLCSSFATMALAITSACYPGDTTQERRLAATAELYFRAVYGCAPESIDEVASPEITVSYPIFETLFGVSSIIGNEAVKNFSVGFCRRWSGSSIVVREALEDGNRVVLVWDFAATNMTAQLGDEARFSWSGISVFRFDELGRVVEEFGEESRPSPSARTQPGDGG